jgi:hypothetical protein
MNLKHYLCRFTETHGEEELTQYVLISTAKPVDVGVDQLLSNWWDSLTDQADCEYSYSRADGTARVEGDTATELTEVTFEELRLLMPHFDQAALDYAERAAKAQRENDDE